MRRKKRELLAQLVQRQGKKGTFMRGTLEGGNIPVVLFKSDYQKNERGEAIWNLYLDKQT